MSSYGKLEKAYDPRISETVRKDYTGLGDPIPSILNDGAGSTERNRRERPRMSDITRAVDKAEQGQVVPYQEEDAFYGQVGDAAKDAAEDRRIVNLNTKSRLETQPVADKNTPN